MKPALWLVALGALIASFTATPTLLAAPPEFAVVTTYPIHGQGGWDYLTLSSDASLLYVPRTTHTQVVESATGKVVADIPGTEHSHGIALVPSLNRAFITDSGDNTVQVVDTKTNTALGKVKAADDADAVIYDPASNKVYVGCGDAGAVVPFSPDVDPAKGQADPAIDLGGKPEFLAADGKGHLYVNVQSKDEIAVIDTSTMKVTARWSTGAGSKPTGLAIDSANGRLYVGCRDAKMRVVSTADGKILAELPIGHGNDACAFANGLAFASNGDGTLAIIGENSPGQFEVVQNLTTAPGARTMALDPASGRVFLPTADMSPAKEGTRARPVPDTFKIIMARPILGR